MKAIYTGFIFMVTALVMSGCESIRDNRDDCPDPEERNLVIHFEYTDSRGEDIFADRIEMVDLVMFDRDYNFYNWIYVSKTSLDEFRGVCTTVDPGEYHIVCWANVSSSREDIENGHSLTSALNHYGTASADPLHYGPDLRALTAPVGRSLAQTRLGELSTDNTWMLEVAESGVTEDTIAFMSAHRTVNVYLQNFPGMDDPVPIYPMAAIENLSDFYNLNLSRTAPEIRNFVQTTGEVTIEGERYAHGRFYIPHFDDTNNVNVVVTTPEPHTVTEVVPMDKILELNGVTTVYDGDDLVLDLLMIWGDTHVRVELPKFKSQDVGPEF